MLEKVFSYIDGAVGAAQHHSVQSYLLFCKDTGLRDFASSTRSLINELSTVNRKMKGVNLVLFPDLTQCEYLFNGGCTEYAVRRKLIAL